MYNQKDLNHRVNLNLIIYQILCKILILYRLNQNKVWEKISN